LNEQPPAKLSGERPYAAKSAASALRPFRNPVYRTIWIATVVANIGGWIYNAAAGWLMTSLDSSPVMVSLVQVAASLPMFMFALPAGALADIIDRRRFIVMLEIVVALLSAIFASFVTLGWATPELLLLFMFLLSSLSALEAPAWQAIVPELVTRDDLPSAVTANSVGVNISRAIGPALARPNHRDMGHCRPLLDRRREQLRRDRRLPVVAVEAEARPVGAGGTVHERHRRRLSLCAP
jgi:uncharacterized protein involved in cysteine biosynthesis